jgi:multiple sugar transport system ATP-binding protein
LAEIVLDGLAKVFAGGVRAVDDVSLTVADGEFMVLVGPSGCGKSTMLRLIAGLEDVTEGTIAIGGHNMTDVAPRNRDVAMVFQNYALYPHKSVRQNLAYGLKVRRTPRGEIRSRVEDVSRILGLDALLERRPSQLSGGQRQRVAMGRAIVREPAAFLMDEPLSNLDAKLRVTMRAELARLHERLGVTTVYVTHDQVEAMTLGQRVAVMRDGKIQQVDRPQALYRHPANLFVAAFIGSPAMNLVEATVEGDEVAFAGFRIPLPPGRRAALAGRKRVILGVRAEAFEDAFFADARLPQIEVHAAVVEELGADAHVIFPIEASRVDVDELRAVVEHEEDRLLADDRALFNARVDARTTARAGDRMRLVVDPERLYFFDLKTREALPSEPGLRGLEPRPATPEGRGRPFARSGAAPGT